MVVRSRLRRSRNSQAVVTLFMRIFDLKWRLQTHGFEAIFVPDVRSSRALTRSDWKHPGNDPTSAPESARVRQ
jgi:hypothetical protein